MDDIQAVWDGLSLTQRRGLVEALARVTVLPTRQGARIFDPETVRIEWRDAEIREASSTRLQRAPRVGSAEAVARYPRTRRRWHRYPGRRSIDDRAALVSTVFVLETTTTTSLQC